MSPLEEKALRLLRDQALTFLKEQAPVALFVFFIGLSAIGVLLNSEEVKNAWVWTATVLIINFISFVLRYFNEEIFKTVERRERFGMCINFFDSITASSCVLFVPQVSTGVAVFMMAMLILIASGSAFTTAGYKPLMWSFAAPLLTILVTTFGYYYFTSSINVYGVAVVLAASSTFLVAKFADSSRSALLKAIKAQLQSDRAQQSKTRFYMASSHDLRQPVSAAAAFVSSALAITDNKEAVDHLVQAKKAINMIDAHIAPMMELAKIDSDEMVLNLRNGDLVGNIRSIVTMFYPKVSDNVELVTSLPEQTAVCNTDYELLRRVISNVIDNSIKYTESGEINITLTKGNSGSYRLVVRDTGIGISAEQLELIFDEFYQVNNKDHNRTKGFGLGLPIANRLCDKLGVKFSIDSRAGEYTSVSLLIPAIHKQSLRDKGKQAK